MRLTEERANLLKSLEESNYELTKAFENYRNFDKNVEFPKSNEDENEIPPKDQNILVELYYSHKEALINIRKCANNLKKEIVNLEAYFKRGEKRQKELRKIFRENAKKYREKHKDDGKE